MHLTLFVIARIIITSLYGIHKMKEEKIKLSIDLIKQSLDTQILLCDKLRALQNFTKFYHKKIKFIYI